MLIGALVVTGVLIGGYTQVSRQSGPYDAALNRSFVAQAAVVADQSNITAASLLHLMRQMQTQDRPDLEAQLDSVVEQSGRQATQAALAASANSPGDIEGQFGAVFADRAAAVRQIRSAVDGLLGMSPLAVAGAPGGGGSVAAPTLLSAVEATGRIAAAGQLLTRADATYQSVRRTLARLAGHATLPRSRWITPAAAALWQTGPLTSRVDELTASTTLAVTHHLVLSTVQLSPPALPSPTGAVQPTSILSPTTRLGVEVVLSDLGSVAEPRATVQFSLTPLPSGAAHITYRRASLSPGASASLTPTTFAVKPGHAYQLVVAIVLPAGQTATGAASLTRDLQIAPST